MSPCKPLEVGWTISGYLACASCRLHAISFGTPTKMHLLSLSASQTTMTMNVQVFGKNPLNGPSRLVRGLESKPTKKKIYAQHMQCVLTFLTHTHTRKNTHPTAKLHIHMLCLSRCSTFFMTWPHSGSSVNDIKVYYSACYSTDSQ